MFRDFYLLNIQTTHLHIDNINGNSLINWNRLHRMVPAIEALRADHTTTHLALATLSPRIFIAPTNRPNRLFHRTETPLQFFNTFSQLIYNFIIPMRFASGICENRSCQTVHQMKNKNYSQRRHVCDKKNCQLICR